MESNRTSRRNPQPLATEPHRSVGGHESLRSKKKHLQSQMRKQKHFNKNSNWGSQSGYRKRKRKRKTYYRRESPGTGEDKENRQQNGGNVQIRTKEICYGRKEAFGEPSFGGRNKANKGGTKGGQQRKGLGDVGVREGHVLREIGKYNGGESKNKEMTGGIRKSKGQKRDVSIKDTGRVCLGAGDIIDIDIDIQEDIGERMNSGHKRSQKRFAKKVANSKSDFRLIPDSKKLKFDRELNPFLDSLLGLEVGHFRSNSAETKGQTRNLENIRKVNQFINLEIKRDPKECFEYGQDLEPVPVNPISELTITLQQRTPEPKTTTLTRNKLTAFRNKDQVETMESFFSPLSGESWTSKESESPPQTDYYRDPNGGNFQKTTSALENSFATSLSLQAPLPVEIPMHGTHFTNMTPFENVDSKNTSQSLGFQPELQVGFPDLSNAPCNMGYGHYTYSALQRRRFNSPDSLNSPPNPLLLPHQPLNRPRAPTPHIKQTYIISQFDNISNVQGHLAHPAQFKRNNSQLPPNMPFHTAMSLSQQSPQHRFHNHQNPNCQTANQFSSGQSLPLASPQEQFYNNYYTQLNNRSPNYNKSFSKNMGEYTSQAYYNTNPASIGINRPKQFKRGPECPGALAPCPDNFPFGGHPGKRGNYKKINLKSSKSFRSGPKNKSYANDEKAEEYSNKYKTELCKNFLFNGKCQWGNLVSII